MMGDWKEVRPWLIGSGMSLDEVEAFHDVVEAAKKVMTLPGLDPIDREDIARSFHTIQNALLAQPQKRAFKSELE